LSSSFSLKPGHKELLEYIYLDFANARVWRLLFLELLWFGFACLDLWLHQYFLLQWPSSTFNLSAVMSNPGNKHQDNLKVGAIIA
jgi:hypothetical protein